MKFIKEKDFKNVNWYKRQLCIDPQFDEEVDNILDKIKDEIEEHAAINFALNPERAKALCWCLNVIDKYKSKNEVV